MKKTATKLKKPKVAIALAVNRRKAAVATGFKKPEKVILHAVNGRNDSTTNQLKKSKGVITHAVKARTARNTYEFEKSKGVIIVEIIEYVPNAILSKTIIKKSTGNISVMSLDTGEGLTEKHLPFDTFAQIIDGKAEIVIDGVSEFCWKPGEGYRSVGA